MRKVHTLGIVELYQMTLCMIAYRLRQDLPPRCVCGSAERQAWDQVPPTSTHYAHVNMFSWRDLSATDLDSVDALTEYDRQVYAAGLHRMLTELAALEVVTNTSILCDKDRETIEKSVDQKTWQMITDSLAEQGGLPTESGLPGRWGIQPSAGLRSTFRNADFQEADSSPPSLSSEAGSANEAGNDEAVPSEGQPAGRATESHMQGRHRRNLAHDMSSDSLSPPEALTTA